MPCCVIHKLIDIGITESFHSAEETPVRPKRKQKTSLQEILGFDGAHVKRGSDLTSYKSTNPRKPDPASSTLRLKCTPFLSSRRTNTQLEPPVTPRPHRLLHLERSTPIAPIKIINKWLADVSNDIEDNQLYLDRLAAQAQRQENIRPPTTINPSDVSARAAYLASLRPNWPWSEVLTRPGREVKRKAGERLNSKDWDSYGMELRTPFEFVDDPNSFHRVSEMLQ